MLASGDPTTKGVSIGILNCFQQSYDYLFPANAVPELLPADQFSCDQVTNCAGVDELCAGGGKPQAPPFIGVQQVDL
jgi:hypothetical protein